MNLHAGKKYFVVGGVGVSLASGVDIMSARLTKSSGDGLVHCNVMGRTIGDMGGGTLSIMYIECITDCEIALSSYGYSSTKYNFDGTLLAIEL